MGLNSTSEYTANVTNVVLSREEEARRIAHARMAKFNWQHGRQVRALQYVRGFCNNLKNPAHLDGDTVELRCKCNDANPVVARCVITCIGRCTKAQLERGFFRLANTHVKLAAYQSRSKLEHPTPTSKMRSSKQAVSSSTSTCARHRKPWRSNLVMRECIGQMVFVSSARRSALPKFSTCNTNSCSQRTKIKGERKNCHGCFYKKVQIIQFHQFKIVPKGCCCCYARS
jgi:hypothetical protein